MSTERRTRCKDHALTSFWGGDARGPCLQVTTEVLKFRETVLNQIQEPGYIQLTKAEALALAADLTEWAEEGNG